MNQPPRIFISYTREDSDYAQELRHQLKEAGYEPILDTEIIPAGGDYMEVLDREIRGADFFLACLSPQALAKVNGFQEWEINLAHDLWKEQYHDRKTYLIPVKFAECELSTKLRRLQYIKFFQPGGLTELLKWIKAEIARLQYFSLSRVRASLLQEAAAAASQTAVAEEDWWLNVIYLETREARPDGQLPPEMEDLRDWMWSHSAYGRCSYVALPEANQAAIAKAALLVLEWSAETAKRARELFKQVRTRKSSQPLLLIVDEGRAPEIEKLIKESQAQFGGTTLTSLTIDALRNPARTQEAFKELKLLEHLCRSNFKLRHDENDLESRTIIEEAGNDQLELALQKYFPQARRGRLKQLKGGWDTARLCRLFVDEQPYLLSLLNNLDDYTRELQGHLAAKEWLREAALALQTVPAVSDPFEPFRVGEAPLYPLCFAAPTPDGQEFCTLKDCYACDKSERTFNEHYATEKGRFIERAYQRLLQILMPPASLSFEAKLPWGEADESPFVWTRALRLQILASLQDLKLYSTQLTNWEDSEMRLRGLLSGPLPDWLSEPRLVALGPTHGYPVPQNCLVNPHQPGDLKLIGCGRYNAKGRLVSDLALIERDLKLMLLCTEFEAAGYRDLEVSQLTAWHELEACSIKQGLAFSRRDVLTTSGSLQRVYDLVCEVRQQAKGVCASSDTQGRHYFAALLYWTLHSLSAPQVRTTKKLFALLSAAEILRRPMP